MTSDDFVAMLRHLTDAAGREAPPVSALRLRGGSARMPPGPAPAGPLGLWGGASARCKVALASLANLAQSTRDLVNAISISVCLVALKILLQFVIFLRACLCCCGGRLKSDGQVDSLTSIHWSLANMILQLQGLNQEKSTRRRAVCDFLGRHRVSPSLALRVRRYVDKSTPQQVRDGNVESLRRLATELLVDLHEELRMPALSAHPFFASLRTKHPQLVRKLCTEALQPLLKLTDDIVFFSGATCFHMYFVISGQAMYTWWLWDADTRKTLDAHLRRTLGAGHCLSEAALWTGWVHRGELRAVTDCLLFLLDASAFARVISSHKTAHVFAAAYARKFVECLNRQQQTDLVESPPVDL